MSVRSDQITAAKLAVNSQAKQCQIPLPLLNLQSNPNGPYFLKFERASLAG